MITDKMKELLTDYAKTLIKGGSFHGASISAGSAKVGLGGNSTSPAAIGIDVDTGAATTISAEKTTTNVLQLFVEVLGSNIQGEVIREMGVFDNAGNLLTRINFDGVGPFSTTERLQIYLTLEVE